MAYDSILVKAGLANTRKFRRLSATEGWCAVMGVWSIAAQSTPRGYLLNAEGEPATEKDFADEAKVTLAVARSTVKKMRALGMIEMDDAISVEYVHDWHEHQKDPKPSESPDAWRERKRAERARKRGEHKDFNAASLAGHANVPRDIATSHANVTPPNRSKRSKGIEDPPDPPKGGRARDREIWREEMAAWVAAHPADPDLHATVLSAVEALQGIDGVQMWTQGIHAHAMVDGTLILGIASERVGWVQDRYAKPLAAGAGMPVQIIDCGCEAAEQAA